MKKLVIAFGVAMVAIASQASYLWFTISNDDTGYSNVSSYLTSLKDAGKITGVDDVYMQVIADNGSSKTTLDSEAFMTSEWQMDGAKGNVDLSALTGALNTYSFYIEICSTAEGVYSPVGSGEKKSYTALQEAGSITETLESITTAVAWHGTGYKATPEPTSAMLMLLGVAGLALKRKQKKA